MLKLLPWDELDRAVERHGAGECARTFTFKSHLVSMLQAQFAGAASLRHIVAGQPSHAARLHHLGAKAARRSSLADATTTPGRLRCSAMCWER